MEQFDERKHPRDSDGKFTDGKSRSKRVEKKNTGRLTSDKKHGKMAKIPLDFFSRTYSEQFGKKAGEHMHELGLDVKNPEHRELFRAIINETIENPDEKRHGFFRGQEEDVIFYIKGENVVLTKLDGSFITFLPGGITNGRVKNAFRYEE